MFSLKVFLITVHNCLSQQHNLPDHTHYCVLFVTWLQDDDSSGADTEEETEDTTPSSGSVTVLSEKTLDNGQKVSVCVCHLHACTC